MTRERVPYVVLESRYLEKQPLASPPKINVAVTLFHKQHLQKTSGHPLFMVNQRRQLGINSHEYYICSLLIPYR